MGLEKLYEASDFEKVLFLQKQCKELIKERNKVKAENDELKRILKLRPNLKTIDRYRNRIIQLEKGLERYKRKTN